MKLADLMKRFGLSAKEVDAQVDLKDTAELQEMLAVLETQETALAEALVTIDELQAEKEALQTQMQEFAEQKAAAEANAKQMKMDARLASLSKEVGDERAAKVLAATEGMDDAAFDAIASALKMSADNEAKSTLFTEQGANEEVSPDARQTETTEMKILKEKFKKSA